MASRNAVKSVPFSRWPIWSWHFPEKDVKRIVAVKYWAGDKQKQLDLEEVRLATGRSGVSALVFKNKHSLPPTDERDDAVTVEYEV